MSGSADLTTDIGRAAQGDHLAFGRIVAAQQGRVFAFLARMGLDRASAEDVAQECFLRVWRNAGQFDPRLGSLATWIITIARNLALTHLARSGRAVALGDSAEAEAAVSDWPQPDAELLLRQRHSLLHQALQHLSAADRALLAASYVDELGLAEIARIEGCSTGAAKLRLHRARARLRLILEKTDA